MKREPSVVYTSNTFDATASFSSQSSDISNVISTNITSNLNVIDTLKPGELLKGNLFNPICNKYDVATYRAKTVSLNYEERKDLIKNAFVPEETFSFPVNNRSFRYEFLKLGYAWLCYSPSEDGAYCLACVLFGYRFPGRASKTENLYSKPFRTWPTACSTFHRHVYGKKKMIIMKADNHCIIKLGHFFRPYYYS